MSKLTQSVLLLPVLGAGFVFGSWLGVERRTHRSPDAIDRRLSEHAPVIAVKQTSELPLANFETEDDLISAMMSALKEDEPLYRDHRLRTLLGHLDTRELTALFARALKISDRGQRQMIFRPLLARWETVDPAAAERAMRPLLERLPSGQVTYWDSKEMPVIDAWARARPDLALALAMTAPDSNWANWLAQVALPEKTEGDPVKQIEVLRGMPANSLKTNLSERAILELAKKDTAAAEANLDLLTDVKQRDRVQCSIISSLAQRDPTAALARVNEIASELGSQEGIRLVSAVISQAAWKDPEAALAAVDGLSGELKTAALGSALTGWVDRSPKEALEWASKNGINISDAKRIVNFSDYSGLGWNTPMMSAFDHDREQTMAWLREQPPSTERDAMLAEGLWSGSFDQRLAIFAELTPEGRSKNISGLLTRGRGVDAAAAEAWVQGLPQGAERVAAVEGLVSLQSEREPARAEELAGSYPEGPERDAAISGAASALRNSNQAKAVELAARITDPIVREAACVSVARTWLILDKMSAQTWISSTQVLNPDVKRVLLRQAAER